MRYTIPSCVLVGKIFIHFVYLQVLQEIDRYRRRMDDIQIGVQASPSTRLHVGSLGVLSVVPTMVLDEGNMFRTKCIQLNLATRSFQELVDGHHEEAPVPGGFGATSAPNDGWHQALHSLTRAFSRVAIGWGSCPYLRRRMDDIQVGLQASPSTRLHVGSLGVLSVVPTMVLEEGNMFRTKCFGKTSMPFISFYYEWVPLFHHVF